MSVQLTAVSPRLSSVGAADDPYKKYWVAILIGFVMTGMWLCLPIMETPVGSAHVDTSKPAVDPNASQSLDSLDNPAGAQGFSVSMEGLKHKSKSDEPIESMLYQAPAEPTNGAAASGAPLGSASASASAASLAQALKDVGEKKDASGWNEKAQKGFTAPRLSGGLSGTGSASGGSSASASAGVSSFGSSNAQIGFGATRGLRDDGSADAKAPVGGVAALRKVAQMTKQAAANRSGDAAVSSNSRIFDGAKAQGIGGPVGPAGAADYAALDAAPANLKLNDPKLDKKEIKEPTPADTPAATSSDNGKQLAMMAASLLIGGAIGGTGGTMVMMMGQYMIQQQEARAAEQRSQENLAKAKAKNGA